MWSDRFKSTWPTILSRVLPVPFVTVALVFGNLVSYFAANLSHQEHEKLVNIATGHRDLIEGWHY